MGSPFLLSEEDQEEENRRQLAAFGNALPARTSQPRSVQQSPAASPARRQPESLESAMNPGHMFTFADPRHLGNMTGAVNKAISDELDSRVAQAREQRRMQHERELMRMRMEAAAKEQEGQMIRDLLSGR